ncbi:MAG: HEAT repeat domain-containing protein [Thermodesulfovibrionales bacterium]|nr:HEAT repeat domain-containing protein [Thermodesulfovibrionales bacterium]
MRAEGNKKLLRQRFILALLLFVVLVPGNVLAGDTLQQIEKELRNRDWQVRLAAVEKLGGRNDETTVELLMKVVGTRSEYWPVQIKAIQLLGETANPKTLPLLLSIFNDTFRNWECPSIKSQTALALANFKGEKKVIETLAKGIHDRELLTREASIQALGKTGDPRAIPYLIEILRDESVAVRLGAVEALETIGDPLAVHPLQYVAEHDSVPLVRERAVTALKNFH